MGRRRLSAGGGPTCDPRVMVCPTPTPTPVPTPRPAPRPTPKPPDLPPDDPPAVVQTVGDGESVPHSIDADVVQTASGNGRNTNGLIASHGSNLQVGDTWIVIVGQPTDPAIVERITETLARAGGQGVVNVQAAQAQGRVPMAEGMLRVDDDQGGGFVRGLYACPACGYAWTTCVDRHKRVTPKLLRAHWHCVHCDRMTTQFVFTASHRG